VDADWDESQIVSVFSSCRLLDTQACEHVYWRRDGLGLATGWYVVDRPRGAVPGRFNEETAFRGPFKQREDAQAAMARMSSRAHLLEALAAKPADPARPVPARSRVEFGANDHVAPGKEKIRPKS
jgi:hypothetical protein